MPAAFLRMGTATVARRADADAVRGGRRCSWPATTCARYRSGRELYAIGSDPAAARLSGIPVGRRVFVAFVVSGALAGLAGVLLRRPIRHARRQRRHRHRAERRRRRGGRRRGDLRRQRLGLRRGARRGAAHHDRQRAARARASTRSGSGAAVGALILAAIGLDRALSPSGIAATGLRGRTPGGRDGRPCRSRRRSAGSCRRASRDLAASRSAGHAAVGPDRARVVAWSVVIVGAAAIEGVASPRFWRFVALESIPIALIALPMTLIIITGEIDLSVASILGLTCAVMGQLWASGVTSLPRADRAVPAARARCSARSTACSSPSSGCRRSPSPSAPWRSTAAWRTWCSATGRSPTTRRPGPRGAIAPIPGTTIPWMILRRRRARRRRSAWSCTPRRSGAALYAMGNNAEAARFAGITVGRTKFWLFVVTGAMSRAGRRLLDAALRQRPGRQRRRPGAGGRRRGPARRRVDLRRPRRAGRRAGRGRAARHAAQRAAAGRRARQHAHDRHRVTAHRLRRRTERRRDARGTRAGDGRRTDAAPTPTTAPSTPATERTSR